MEDDVYVCAWSKSSDGYMLWLKTRPNIRGSGKTYAEAEECLINSIQDVGGAMHAVLEFDPPLPKSVLDSRYSQPEVYLICGDDRFETDAPRRRHSETKAERDERLRWSDGFYDAPVCRTCMTARGRRTNKPITLEYATRFDGAFGNIGCDSDHLIFSEQFLALLTKRERQSLHLQETIWRGRRKFFELIGPDGPPLVAVTGLPPSGRRCPRCNHKTWGYWADGLSIHEFIASHDLPARLESIFTVGVAPEIRLAVTACRWKQLVGCKGTRGFTSELLGIVPDRELVRDPDLPPIGRLL